MKDPKAHFLKQEHGDPVEHGACSQFILEELEASQPPTHRLFELVAARATKRETDEVGFDARFRG